MFIPLRTDAPVYHYPVVCIALLVINVFAFLFTGFGADHNALMTWGLTHGEGLHPVQWVTNNFIHGGVIHLVGNMIFLWGFGLVVEGKLGWWRFLLVYMGIGIAQGAILQTAMLGYDAEKAKLERLEEFGFIDIDAEKQELAEALREEGFAEDEIEEQLENFDTVFLAEMGIPKGSVSFGASTAIFGLLAISLVWAPKNEVSVFVLVAYRPFVFEMAIMWFAALYIGQDLLIAMWTGFEMSTPTLHATGAILGGIVGVAMFKMDMVDCEDWDIFAVWSGHYGPWARDKYGYRIDPKEKQEPVNLEEPVEKKRRKKGPSKSNRASKLTEIAELVEADDFLAASDALYNLRRRDAEAIPDEATLKSLAIGLAKSQMREDAIPLMENFIEFYPESATAMQLRLAGVHLALEDRRSALAVLRNVDKESLSDKQKTTFKKLVQSARGQDA